MLSQTKVLKIPPGVRSQNKAFLVLLGLTGAGKTCTLNYLFDGQEIVRQRNFESETSQIREYSVTIPVEKAGTLELRVIDTPGFGDTRQKPLERDAQFMATFDNYLKTHPDLKSCYPTTVLLVVKYDDDRIDGESSHFIQMLKAIDSLLAHYRLLDMNPTTCNLLVVLTHTMSEENPELRADPSAKVKLIEGLITTFTNIPTPVQVVMAENKPDLYNLPEKNGYFKLPNGQYYPINLFNKILTVTRKCQDEVGELIITEAFKNPTGLKKELFAERELLPPENPFVKMYYDALSHARFNIEATSISRKLKTLWEALDEKDTKSYFNTLQITQSLFHKAGIFTIEDIPKTKESILALLAELPINPPLVKVLETLGINPPELPGKTLGVGSFYNIFGDVITGTSPFDVHEFACTEIGYTAPKCVRAKAIGETVVFVSVYSSRLQYHKERIAMLKVDGEMSPEHFTGKAQPGHNIIDKADEVCELSGIKEHRQFEVCLARTPPRLSPAFKRSLEELGPLSSSSRAAWNSFFMANGTHVVKSAYAGGYIEVTAVRNQGKSQTTSIEVVLQFIREILVNIGTLLVRNAEAIEDWTFSLHFHGGDPNLVKPSLPNVFSNAGIEFYRRWTSSLQTHPALLQSEVKLENLVIHVQEDDLTLASRLDFAMQTLTYATGFISRVELHPIPRAEIKPQRRWYHKFTGIFKKY